MIEYQKDTTTFQTFFKHSVTIQEGDGYATKLFAKKGKRVFEVVPDYLAYVVTEIDGRKKPGKKGVLDLFVADQEYISIKNYYFNYGNILNLYNSCPKCGDPIHTRKDLDELEIVPIPDGLVGEEDPVMMITLPKTKVSASIGFLTGHQEQLLMSLEANGNSDPNQADLQVLRELDGQPPTYEDVINLPEGDHYAIREAREQMVCGYKAVAVIACNSCGFKEVSNFLMSRGFLLPKG